MKKRINKIEIIEGIILVIATISIITNDFLKSYGMLLFLLILYPLLYKKEAKTKFSVKETFLEVTIFLLTFLILYYLFGLAIGFTRSGNLWTIETIGKTLIPLGIYIIEKEVLRNNLLSQAENKYPWLTILTFLLLDCSNYLGAFQNKEAYEKIFLLALLLPEVLTNNIVATHLTKKEGFLPVIFYEEVICLYPIILPAIPNASIFLNTTIYTILPILLWVRMRSFDERREQSSTIEDNKINLFILMFPALLTILAVYVFSGLFRYHIIVIGTTNMQPAIDRGDLVIIDQKEKETYEVGKVIAYQDENHLKIGRILSKEEETYFPATERDEKTNITREQITGTISWKIKYLGLPVLWMNHQ